MSLWLHEAWTTQSGLTGLTPNADRQLSPTSCDVFSVTILNCLAGLPLKSGSNHFATAMLQRKKLIRKSYLGYAERCQGDRASRQHSADFWQHGRHAGYRFAQIEGKFGISGRFRQRHENVPGVRICPPQGRVSQFVAGLAWPSLGAALGSPRKRVVVKRRDPARGPDQCSAFH